MSKKRKPRPDVNAPGRVGYRVKEWGEAAGFSNGTVYNLIGADEIKVARIGRATVILDPPREFLERKAAEQRAARLAKAGTDEAATAPAPSPPVKRGPGRPRRVARREAAPPPAPLAAHPADRA
jgi:hypothetical protein